MPKISGPAVYSCPWCGRSVEQGESCWCKQSQEEAMTRQEIRVALKGARADIVRLTAERDHLQARVRELENSFFCPHCNAKFPTTTDGAIEALEHEQTCKQSPIVQERDALRAENARMRDALEWYADEQNYKLLGDYCPFSGADWTFRHILSDGGASARAALKPAGGEPHV